MKKENYNLRIPGPTPLPKKVLKAQSRQMINHRGRKYEKMQRRIIENLKYFFETKNEIYLLTASGMGGLEAAVVNFFSSSDLLIFFTCGEFGNRWVEIGRRFGANVLQIKFSAGKSVDKDRVYRVLEDNTNVKGVFFTHNETATGVLNNIEEIIPIIQEHKAKPLLLIDSISALGAVRLPMDELGIDVLLTASQKAWMAPPGIAMIAVSSYAWDKHREAKMPRYYFDLSLYKEFAQKNQTPATPAVSILYGLDQALTLMKKEGKENIYQRHIKLMNYLRNKIRKLNLKLFVEDANASPTITSIVIPKNVDYHKWLEILQQKYRVIMAGGMGETKGKIVRIAHMGYVSKNDIDQVVDALNKSLRELNYQK